MLKVITHDLADQDAAEQYLYLEEAQSKRLADLFVRATHQSFRFLAQFPGSGSLYVTRKKGLKDIRCWPIRGFPHHIIYYRVEHEVMRIIRILHGSRGRITSLLGASL